MKSWKFGVVGAGVIGDFHCRAINDAAKGELDAICDIDINRAKALADKYGGKAFGSYQEMLADRRIDIMTVGTPSGLHAEPAIEAAKAGVHVLCEKPIDITLERIDAMLSAHDKAGTKLGCIFQGRFAESLKPMHDAVEQGRFGTITYAGIYVPWWRTEEYYQNNWHGTWKLDGGGAMMNQAIHMVDMLCNIMPPVESVQAYTNSIGHPQIETEDTAVAVVRFTTGALGVIYGTTSSYPGSARRFELFGTKGSIVYTEGGYSVFDFADKRDEDKKVMAKYGKVKSESGYSDPAAFTPEYHTKCINAFVESIEGGKEFMINGPEARKSVELILAMYQAAKQQKPVILATVS